MPAADRIRRRCAGCSASFEILGEYEKSIAKYSKIKDGADIQSCDATRHAVV
jgi:hypothetical protein